MFDRVVCINLDRRMDRWESFREGFPSDWPFVGVDRVRAIDGDLAGPPPWFTTKVKPRVERNRHRGGWGCCRSHARIMEDALCDGVESILVLEDDAVFVDDFSDRAKRFVAEVPDDWDQVYFGGQHLGVDDLAPVQISQNVLRCRQVNRTHAYAIRGAMISSVYRMAMTPPDAEYEQALHIDHRLGHMHATGGWNVYAPAQWLVGQRSGISDVSITGSPVHCNFWDSGIGATVNA